MDGDRKYRQHGYQDGKTGHRNEPRNEPGNEPANGQPGERFVAPRHPLDITAPRTPRMVRSVAASRCFDCGNAVAPGFNFAEPCPKCAVDLHCCKQCAHFDSAAHFQCLKPVAERISPKDKRNECELFSPRVTVARDSTPPPALPKIQSAAPLPRAVPRNVHNAREAFENLFKK